MHELAASFWLPMRIADSTVENATAHSCSDNFATRIKRRVFVIANRACRL